MCSLLFELQSCMFVYCFSYLYLFGIKNEAALEMNWAVLGLLVTLPHLFQRM